MKTSHFSSMAQATQMGGAKIMRSLRKGFTLVELLVAMMITATLVILIMQMTNKGLEIFKVVSDEVATSSQARVAMRAMTSDIESMQMRLGDNKYQWFLARSDQRASDALQGMKVPYSAQCIFFTSAFDRNPAVGSSEQLRDNYRNARAYNEDTQGDVNAVSYTLLFRDQILNIPGVAKGERGTFPLFSLYRQLISARDAHEELLGREDLESAYVPFETEESRSFLCENIVEMNFIFVVKYAPEISDTEVSRTSYDEIVVPVVGPKVDQTKLEVYGDRVVYNGRNYEGGFIAAVDISVTVVTEEGMNLINQVRLGMRKAPSVNEFFTKYTQTYARKISPPMAY